MNAIYSWRESYHKRALKCGSRHAGSVHMTPHSKLFWARIVSTPPYEKEMNGVGPLQCTGMSILRITRKKKGLSKQWKWRRKVGHLLVNRRFDSPDIFERRDPRATYAGKPQKDETTLSHYLFVLALGSYGCCFYTLAFGLMRLHDGGHVVYDVDLSTPCIHRR